MENSSLNFFFFYILSRFHRAAFIFIGNMALADFVLVIVEIAVVQIELNTKDQIRQTLYNSHEDFEEIKVGYTNPKKV